MSRNTALLGRFSEYTENQALALCVCGIIVVLTVYFFVDLFRPQPDRPWKNAITLSSIGYMELNYKDAVLRRFFAPEKIGELKDELDKKLAAKRSAAFGRRKNLILQVAGFAHEYLCTSSTPRILQQAMVGRDFASACGATHLENASDKNYQNADLVQLRDWLDSSSGQLRPGKQADEKYFAEGLSDQLKLEKNIVKEITSEVGSLEPPVSFLWLYHPGFGWIFEVVIWSILGVLSNSLIAVMRTAKKGGYDSRQFILFVPKLVLAPVLSILFVALWASGFTESKVEYLNLPYFLVMSFVLGFASERLTDILRRTVNYVLSGMEVSPEKVERLAKGPDLLRLVRPADVNAVGPADTLGNAKRKASVLVTKIVEDHMLADISARQIH